MHFQKFVACLFLQHSLAMPEDLHDVSQKNSKNENEWYQHEEVVSRRNSLWDVLIKRLFGQTEPDPINERNDDGPVVVFPQCQAGSGVCYSGGEKLSCGLPYTPPFTQLGRIVNGSDAQTGSYPWIVGIQFIDKLYCGGSLITDKYVLSAGHCFKGINPRRIRLIIGDHDRRQLSPHQQTRYINRVTIHPQFVKRTFNNDIALILMDRPVHFTEYIRPVCLPTNDRSYNHQNTTIVGWGKLAERGAPADILQEVVVPIIKQKKCREQTKYRPHEITKNMLCAGYDNGILDACQGDSGGPMVWNTDERKFYTQIGIVSWGQGCAREGFPGVYTRIGRYLNWIIDNTRDSCFCT